VRQSNGYILGFTVALTVICAGALAGVFQVLKPEHVKQEKLDKKKQILSAVVKLDGKLPNEIAAMYNESIEAITVDFKGNSLSDVNAETVNVLKEFKKKDASQKQFPVFIYNKGEAYIIPMYGNGLWDAVWGFIALDGDKNTIKGISFGHKGETPGLGARITNQDVKDRFIGKKIYDADGSLGRSENGSFAGVWFEKGEKKVYPEDGHQVDGLAGASMTTEGVNSMLKSYLEFYTPYFKLDAHSNVKPIEKKEEVAVVDTLSGTNNAEAADSTLINDTIQE
jgi:Na+-transporting NADH:ubiquinone oxidoreductase subunit C